MADAPNSLPGEPLDQLIAKWREQSLTLWAKGDESKQQEVQAFRQCANELSEAVERLRLRREPAGWQPIELSAKDEHVAPWDGSEVLLGAVGMRMTGYWQKRLTTFVTTRGNFSGPFTPTHWMPLPDPPAGREPQPNDERKS